MFKLFVVLTVSMFGAAFAWGGALLWGTAVSLITLLAVWAYNRYGFVQIPEMEVGVLFHKRRQSFARFVPGGRHTINPFTEQFSHTIPTSSGSANGRCLAVQTSGGIALDVEWSVNFDIDPFQIKASARPKLARNLPKKANSIVSKHLDNCLRHVLGEMTVDQVCEPGATRRLERAVKQQLTARLAEAGFSFSRIMIGAIDMPRHVKAALEAAQERAVQTENEARSLARLQQVVSQFSEADMQRLMELERIHTLGQNGVTLVYPTAVNQTSVAGRPSFAKLKRGNTRLSHPIS
ncbi:MAG: SPFH domain-containing protein [Ardenticatenaceae bacterium]|nr:SPFH domain-containing protein [Anaerolineales bacterium]MCB8942072.1 SPFH domain-containing protein [Ardenticatenaceae bacterium]MCB8973168.1 SPFH domain-containing protein [Ardenticatenaceae bacterium]